MNPIVVPSALTAAQTITKNVNDLATNSKSFITTIRDTLELFGKLSDSTMNVSASLQDVAVDVENEQNHKYQLYTIKYVLVISRSYLFNMGREIGIIHLVINKKMRILDENTLLTLSPVASSSSALGAATTTNSNNTTTNLILPGVFNDYPEMDNIVKEFDKRVLMQYDPADLEEISLQVKNVTNMIRDAFSNRSLNNGFNHFYKNAKDCFKVENNILVKCDEDEDTPNCYSCFCFGTNRKLAIKANVFKGTFAITNGTQENSRGFIKSSYFVPRVTIIIGNGNGLVPDSKKKDTRFELYNNIKKWNLLYTSQKQIITSQLDLLKSLDGLQTKPSTVNNEASPSTDPVLVLKETIVKQLLHQASKQNEIVEQYQKDLEEYMTKNVQDLNLRNVHS